MHGSSFLILFLGGYDFFPGCVPYLAPSKSSVVKKSVSFHWPPPLVFQSQCIFFSISRSRLNSRDRGEPFSGCYVFAQAVTYLLWLHRFSQLVKGFVHEHEDNVAPS